MVICLGRGADLHMSQLMPLPLTISCSRKSRLVLVLPFWYQLTRVVPDKIQDGHKTVVWCVCVIWSWTKHYVAWPPDVLLRKCLSGRTFIQTFICVLFQSIKWKNWRTLTTCTLLFKSYCIYNLWIIAVNCSAISYLLFSLSSFIYTSSKFC